MKPDSLIGWLVAAPVILSILAQAMLYVAAGIELRRIRKRDRHRMWHRILASPLSPRVSVLVPAYNEEVSIVASVRGLLALTYPNLEVIVINDGSKDSTMDSLIEAFDLTPVLPVFQRVLPTQRVRRILRSAGEDRLVVVDKDNGGKADSLNAAINIATGELVCAIDADTLVNPEALQQLVPPFLDDDDVTAVGGTVRLVNDAESLRGAITRERAPRHPLVGAQVVEYTRAFLVGRLAWNPLGGNLIISGAFGVFRRDRVVEIGGYAHDSVGEDMELVVRLRRQAYEDGRVAKVLFSPDPVAWTEAPQSIRTLARQRNRWFRGLLEVLTRHRSMIGRRRYGSAGLVAMPYFVLVEALAPVMEIAGLVLAAVGLSLGWIGPSNLLVLVTAYLIGAAATVLVMVFDDVSFATRRGLGDRLRLTGFVLLEQLFFRPATLVWRMWGLVLFLQGRKDWGVQERQGFGTPAVASS